MQKPKRLKIDNCFAYSSKQITLINRAITDKDIQYLCSKWFEKQSVQFRLYRNQITHFGLKFLSDSNWISTTFLSLSNNRIGDKGCKYLAAAQWPGLKILFLAQNNISDCGLKHLMKARWSQLRQLGLYKNNFVSEGAISLSKGDWPKLKELCLQSSEQPTSYTLPALILADWQLQTLSIKYSSSCELAKVLGKHSKLKLQQFE